VATLNPLVSTEWLGYELLDDDIRIVDCRFYLAEPGRGAAEYATAHIPSAGYCSLDEHLTATEGPGRHPLPAPADFATVARNLGIEDHHTVVVYDQGDAGVAARMWWMLRSLGHERTAVLDGGWAAWVSEPRSTTSEVPEWAPGILNLASEWSGVVDRESIERRAESLFLIDSRATQRHRGELEPIDPVAGHIPGSQNIPYQGNTDDTGRFLPIEELAERFRHVNTSQETVAYCGSGVTACQNILAMEAAGISGVALYPGSWSDWCTSGGEIAVGS
jgi:thiosulfate/3-mercaptopyruvate sulfurtransferase